jgi:hypothetical protein
METESHRGVAVPYENLKPFIPTPRWERGETYLAYEDGDVRFPPGEMRAWTWRSKVTPDIWPNMSKEQLKARLQDAAINTTIKTEVRLWELIEAVRSHDPYGRLQLHRDKDGRFIRLVGLTSLAKGWDVPTLICDATGDAELYRAIWPHLEEPEPHGCDQLPRPPNVRVFQCVDRAISKWAVAIEGQNLTESDQRTKSAQQDLDRRREGAQRLYAAVLMQALQYGGADVGIIVYKSTKEWIQKNCFVPSWLKLIHWGDLTGTNTLQRVRALFVTGRPLASAEDVTRQAEALFGVHIPQRDYVMQRKRGRIPIVPDVTHGGVNTIRVDVWEHPHRTAERLRQQITEGNIIQAIGRARAGLRGPNEPLDLHLWTDVPIPELGPVEPVLWDELDAGPDGVMLAVEGWWLRSITDAVRACKGLFSADGLKTARLRGGPPQIKLGQAGVRVFYQCAGAGRKPSDAVVLKGIADPRGWLEERLGPLAHFDVETDTAA